MNTAPKISESIPAVTTPVRMPRLVPGRGRFLAGVITGGVLIVLDVVLFVVAMAVTR